MTEKQIKHKEKRKALQELSKIAKIRISMDCEGMRVNEVLIQEFYTDKNHQEFKTFHDWKKSGLRVKKGEEAFLIWGKPKIKPNQELKEGEEEDEFFPICYLFSNAQVH